MIRHASTHAALRHGPGRQGPGYASHAALPFDAVDDLQPKLEKVQHATLDDFDALDWLQFWLPQSDWRVGPRARLR
ncbi:MAG TPA: hypothetical protein VF319_02000 [Caldimonas sp.]